VSRVLVMSLLQLELLSVPEARWQQLVKVKLMFNSNGIPPAVMVCLMVPGPVVVVGKLEMSASIDTLTGSLFSSLEFVVASLESISVTFLSISPGDQLVDSDS